MVLDEASLVEALWAKLPCANYATAGEIDPAVYHVPTSIRVDGAGDIALPLSHDDFLKLKGVSTQAPYGRGEETLLDSNVRRAWQVEAAKVSCPQIPEFFSKVVLDLAVPAMTELGIDADALGLEVRLYKLLVYEQGGHFKFHRDTEKEVGMFATMILQLPTHPGHEGGQLEICHRKKTVTYDFSGAKSMTGYFKMVFFCDCEHKLVEVMDGIRLCLVFSLVRNNLKFMDVDVGTALVKVQSLLKGWPDDSTVSSKPLYAIPLGHKYSRNSLSFAGLKGYDRVVATLLLSCESFLDIHLCMLVKHVKSNHIFDTHRVWHTITHWITKDDKEVNEFVNFISFPFGVTYILNQDGDHPFNERDSADEQSSESYNGNDGGDTNSQYYTAALVVWPKNRKVEALCAIQPPQNVLKWLEEQHKQDPNKTNEYLKKLLAVVSKNTRPKNINQQPYGALLEFCITHGFHDAASTVMKEWALVLVAGYRIKLAHPASALSSAIRKYGWDDVYRDVVHGVLEQHDLMGKWPGLADFPRNLAKDGFQEAAVCVGKKLAYREDLSLLSDNYLVGLVKFFVKNGLEDEAWHAVDKFSSLNAPCLALIMKRWKGTAGLPRVYDLLEKRLKRSEQQWKASTLRHRCPPTHKQQELQKIEREGRTSFLKDVAKLVLALEEKGCRSSALALAQKDFKDVSLDELYNKVDKIDDMDAMVLLLRCEERFRDKIRSMKLPSLSLLTQMRKAADLIGFETMKAYFTEALSRRLAEDQKPRELPRLMCVGQRLPSNKPRFSIELLDNVFWLGDEKLVADVVKAAESYPLSTDALFAKPKEGNKAGLLERAKEWSEVAKNGFRKVVEARMRYLSDEIDDDDETPSKRQKMIYRMQRVKQDNAKERFTEENEQLRDILASIEERSPGEEERKE